MRQEIEFWRDAIAGEVGSLVEKGAIEIYRGERAREYLREHPAATSYPAKPVFVAKDRQEEMPCSYLRKLHNRGKQREHIQFYPRCDRSETGTETRSIPG